MQKGFFGSLFDFDGDGELNAAESTYDLMRFNEIMNDADKINELENAGTTYEDLWYMSDYCKCQYKNVGFLENKNVVFLTRLFSIFLIIFCHILNLIF